MRRLLFSSCTNAPSRDISLNQNHVPITTKWYRVIISSRKYASTPAPSSLYHKLHVVTSAMSMVTTKIMYLLMIICFNPHTIITHLDQKTRKSASTSPHQPSRYRWLSPQSCTYKNNMSVLFTFPHENMLQPLPTPLI